MCHPFDSTQESLRTNWKPKVGLQQTGNNN